MDGALTISEFAEALEVNESAFGTSAYDTVAGLVLFCMGSVPAAKPAMIELHIEIVDMDGNRIDKLLSQNRGHGKRGTGSPDLKAIGA